MAERRLRVLAVAQQPAQYQAPLFRRMAARSDLELQVAYCTLRGAEAAHDPEFGATVQWDVPLLDGYSWVQVPNRGSGGESFWGLRNPGLWRMIREGQFDAVLCYVSYRRATFWIARVAAWLSRVAFLFGTDTTTLNPLDGRMWKRSVKRVMWPWLFRMADQVIVPSSGSRDLMRSLGIPDERVTITPYVVDNDWWLEQTAKVDRAAARAAWGATDAVGVVLFCAKLQPWKRPFDLLEAFAKNGICEALLVYAGEGPLRGELKARAEALGVAGRVRFLGFVNQSQLPGIYTAADLMVLPSAYDAFGVVVNEAMLCGCVVAASDHVGAARDLIAQGRTGFVYPCGDIEALAEVLRRAFGDRARLRELGQGARARMETWSPRENIEATLEAVSRGVGRVRRGKNARRWGAGRGETCGERLAKTSRMKLLVYSHSFAPKVGGIETIVLSLTRGLAELRGEDGKPQFELTLVTQTPTSKDSDDRLLAEFPVIRQPGILRLWRLIRAVDVLHLAGPALLPLLLARLAGKPVVIEHHGYQAICPNGLLVELPERKICPGYFQARRYDKCVKCQACEMSWLQGIGSVLSMFPRNWLVRRAARNIAISQHQLKRIALPSTLLIYHGVEDVADAAPVSSGSANEGKICFGYIGRFVPEKGLGALLEAVERLKEQEFEFELLLIGDGPERVKVEERIVRSGLSNVVRCTGFLQGAAFTEVTKTVHVFLMPSSWEETAGLAAIEQMMRGRLVMAARIGGLGEIVGSAGITFKPGRADDLARAIEEVLRNSKVIATLGAKARERARELFVRKRMIEDHARLYDDISLS